MPGDEPSDERPQAGGCVPVGVRFAQGFQRPYVAGPDDLEQQVLLRPEVYVERSRRQAHGGGDIPGRGRVIPAGREAAHPRRQQAPGDLSPLAVPELGRPVRQAGRERALVTRPGHRNTCRPSPSCPSVVLSRPCRRRDVKRTVLRELTMRLVSVRVERRAPWRCHARSRPPWILLTTSCWPSSSASTGPGSTTRRSRAPTSG